MSSLPSRARFESCLLAGALGDAVGYGIEFTTYSDIRRDYGLAPPAGPDLDGAPPAEISDDTQMTLFTAEGLARFLRARSEGGEPDFARTMTESLVRWLSTQEAAMEPPEVSWSMGLTEERRLNNQRSPGNTCTSSLRQIAGGGDIPSPDNPINESKGCGGVMRVAPCGLVAESAEEAFDWGIQSAALTHSHPSGYLAAGYMAALVWELARDEYPEEAMETADELLAGHEEGDEVRQAVDKAVELAEKGLPEGPDIKKNIGEGWVAEEALAIALSCVLAGSVHSSRGIRETLWHAAAHDGDSDSTASIAGHLIGAQVDVDGLPDIWLDDLELRDVITDVAGGLHEAASG